MNYITYREYIKSKQNIQKMLYDLKINAQKNEIKEERKEEEYQENVWQQIC